MNFEFPDYPAAPAPTVLALFFAGYVRLKTLLLLLLCLALGLIWRQYELEQQAKMVYAGVPISQKSGPNYWLRHWRNPGFMVGYSEWRRNALWVSYKLTVKPQRHSGPRPRHFTVDNRSLTRVSSSDFSNGGFNRGHLAPNYAISSEYGRQAQLASFKMSNISPQSPRLNQKLWQRLEEVVIDHFLPRKQSLWILTGPLFDEHISRLKSGVEIPDAFYKIIIKPADENGPVEAISFVMPQRVKGTEPLSNFISSIDQIEAATGLDFLHGLDKATETHLEANISDGLSWNLASVDNNPPRY